MLLRGTLLHLWTQIQGLEQSTLQSLQIPPDRGFTLVSETFRDAATDVTAPENSPDLKFIKWKGRRKRGSQKLQEDCGKFSELLWELVHEAIGAIWGGGG